MKQLKSPDNYLITFCKDCHKKIHKVFGKETHWSALLPMGGIAAPLLNY
jgi:hypothetical protein